MDLRNKGKFRKFLLRKRWPPSFGLSCASQGRGGSKNSYPDLIGDNMAEGRK